jgi:hypothetical protein
MNCPQRECKNILRRLIHNGAQAHPTWLRIDFREHTAKIGQIATDDSGRYLVTASIDKTARVWSLADERMLKFGAMPPSMIWSS